MMDFQIRKSTRRCHQSGRELVPGDVYFSELVPEGDGDSGLIRHDYCEDAWNGPSDSAVGWWRSRIPLRDSNRVYWVSDSLLLDYFLHQRNQPDNADRVWLMAMLLLRKKLVKQVDDFVDESGTRHLGLRLPEQGADIQVIAVAVEPAVAAAIQDEFAEHLFTDQPPEPLPHD